MLNMEASFEDEKRNALFCLVENLVGLNPSIIGIVADGLLVKIDEKNFCGVTGAYLTGNGGITQKARFLFGKNKGNEVSYRGGKLKIYFA